MNINRQPAGQPTGGQFAEGARAGADVSLSGGTTVAAHLSASDEGELVIYDQFHTRMTSGPSHDLPGVSNITVSDGLGDGRLYAVAEVDTGDTHQAYETLTQAAPPGATNPREWVDENTGLIQDMLSEEYPGLDFEGGTLEDTYAIASAEVDASGDIDQVPVALRDGTSLDRFQADVVSGQVWSAAADRLRSSRVDPEHQPSKVHVNPVDESARATGARVANQMERALRLKDKDPRVPVALRVLLDDLDADFSEDADHQNMDRSLSTIEQVSPKPSAGEVADAWKEFERHARSFGQRYAE